MSGSARQRRKARREHAQQVRQFEAARADRLRVGWAARASRASADAMVYRDLAELRARSREQAINNPYAKRFLQLLSTQVLGPEGPRLQIKATTASGEPDPDASAAVVAGWEAWARPGCEVTGRLTLGGVLALWLQGVARDGEALLRRVRGWGRNPYGYALQLLEPDRLDLLLNRELPGGARIRMGVELDPWGAPVAYYLLSQHPGEYEWSYQGRQYMRVPASEIFHSFIPLRAEATRGVPWAHASMVELHHLSEYRGSEMIAAEMGAKRTGFYEFDPDAFDNPHATAATGSVRFAPAAGPDEDCPDSEIFTRALAERRPLDWRGAGGAWTLQRR
jgi:lambda family phage portal protein